MQREVGRIARYKIPATQISETIPPQQKLQISASCFTIVCHVKTRLLRLI